MFLAVLLLAFVVVSFDAEAEGRRSVITPTFYSYTETATWVCYSPLEETGTGAEIACYAEYSFNCQGEDVKLHTDRFVRGNPGADGDFSTSAEYSCTDTSSLFYLGDHATCRTEEVVTRLTCMDV